MKKIVFYSALALFIIAGCTKEIDTPVVEEPQSETVTILARVAETKTTHSDRVFSWQTGEEVSVGTSEGEYVAFEADDVEAGTFKHTFGGSAPSLLMAVTPKQSGATFTSANDYTVNFPVSYSDYVPGTTNALMIGAPDPVVDNKFLFNHVGSLLKITYANVPIGTTAFVLESDANITGTVSLTGTDLSDIEIANDNAGLTGKLVTLNLPSAVTETNSTMTFCVPLPTGTYSTLKIYLMYAGGKIKATEKNINKALTLARGDVMIFPEIVLTAATVLTENFSATNASSNQYNCSSNIATDANREDFDFTWSSGTGTVFKNGIKLGNGDGVGNITCSNILSGIGTGKLFTVKVYCADYNTDGSSVKLTYNSTNSSQSPANSAITTTSKTYSASDFENANVFSFEKAESVNDLVLASVTKRLFVDKIEVIYGLVGGKIPVADPVFSVPEGRVDLGTTVSLSCGTAGATIYYTTDGSTPTSSSETYSSPFTIMDNITIKAIAIKDGNSDYEDSNVITKIYTVGQVEDPVISVANNVITIICETEGAEIYYTTNGNEPTKSDTQYTSTIDVGNSDSYTLKARAFKDGYKSSAVVDRAIAYVVPISVEAPTFSPLSGSSVAASGTITITTSTSDATIYYTTDGTTPTESSSHGTIGASSATVSAAFEIKAIAIKSGNSSLVSTATYSLIASKTSFTAVSGDISADGLITYTTAKNDGTSNPAINSNEIRLYQPSAKKTDGGSITISAASGYQIESISLTSSMGTTIVYKVDGGSVSSNVSLTASTAKTFDSLDASSVEFICRGTSSTTRLYVKALSVTYSKK